MLQTISISMKSQGHFLICTCQEWIALFTALPRAQVLVLHFEPRDPVPFSMVHILKHPENHFNSNEGPESFS
jgi:hypothetical protein